MCALRKCRDFEIRRFVMLEKKSSWLLTVAACAVASQGVAQGPADIHEQALELARQQQELAREQEALNREYRPQQADFVREHAARQRELATELSRVKALSAVENAKLQQQMVQ